MSSKKWSGRLDLNLFKPLDRPRTARGQIVDIQA